MSIIKCKMCGGDIELTADKTFGTCEYCGSTMTLPKVSDEQRAAAFNRGNHFRRIGEFDKALAVYERIVQEDDTDAEAHWCCALCRFGIEYVEDPTTYEWLPTCHRASFDNFLEDVDYLAAVEHSDGITRRQYQKDAAKIAEVQRGILATSQNEEPFDVFICYKESDENGERTRDSILAQDIYYRLTEQGRRVFFARITLEDKAGTEYEPYIFAALNSAKVMIAVGTKPEHFNAVWVKNEWSRFLSLMKKDRSKLLLPCYRDMDPYDLPEQLSVLQSYDMSKIGFLQDLIHGVSKVLDADKKPAKETVVVQQNAGGTNVVALLKRGNMALEDGDWEKADGFFEEVLNLDAECAEAYVGKLMAELQVRERAELGNREEPFGNNRNYQKTIRFGSEALKAELTGYNAAVVERQRRIEQERLEWEARKQQEHLAKMKQLEKQRLRTAAAGKCISSSGYDSTVGLKSDGTVVAVGRNDDGQCDVSGWTDIIAVSAGIQHTVGLRSNGTVVAAGKDRYGHGLCDVSRWRDIVSVNASATYTIGVRSDGTVVAVGNNDCGQCDVSGWRNIVSVSVESTYTVGLKSDGTVVAAGEYAYGRDVCGVRVWSHIVAVCVRAEHTVGLRFDGTVVALGRNDDGRCNVRAWTDIVAISVGDDHTVGLKSDGTVVAVGNNGCSQCDVGGWTDIVAVSAGRQHTVGLRSDGTVVAVGYNGYGRCDVSDWTDIVAISAGDEYTVGLKSDGTVVAVGNNDHCQCDVSGWKLFNSLDTLEQERAEEKKRRIAQLQQQKTALQTELVGLKGLFTGKRRREIEAKLARIEAELKE
ncbi:MAG: TIR domain-containing protein [Faecousia sp.]